MTTAKKMREVTEEAAKRKKENAKRAEEARKAYRRKLVKQAKELFPGILDQVLAGIEQNARNGYTAFTMSVFEYEYSEHKRMAYEMVAKELATRKYGYRITGPELEDGYNGDGNNSHDFYTIYSWKVSW